MSFGELALSFVFCEPRSGGVFPCFVNRTSLTININKVFIVKWAKEFIISQIEKT